MKKIILILVISSITLLEAKKAELVTTFKGIEVTGVTVNREGEIFVNFPRWRKDIPYSVAEVKDKKTFPYPNKTYNSYNINDKISLKKFISVQSVVAYKNLLYIVDTANPFIKTTIAKPRVFVYNTKSKKMVKIYTMSSVVSKYSYINDLRRYKDKLYLTDSGVGGIIIIDTKNGKKRRVLHRSKYTTAQKNDLLINNKPFKLNVHSDGIALDRKNKMLYIHALKGHMLYGFKLADLDKINPKPVFKKYTSAPDGMIYHKGYLYYGDLENSAINRLNLKTKKETIFYKNKDIVKWPDTFSIHKGYLYFTNSKINEVLGKNNISKSIFTLYKIKIDK